MATERDRLGPRARTLAESTFLPALRGVSVSAKVCAPVCMRARMRDDPCVGVRASLHASFLAYSCNGGGKPPPHMCIHVCKAIMGKLPGGSEGCASACIWRLQCAAAPVSTTCMHA